MNEEPEAYKIGWIPFLGLKIYLDSRPLIPRPETEWWCEELTRTISEFARSFAEPKKGALVAAIATAPQKVLGSPVLVGPDFFRDGGDIRVLDLCAGSGAIGCAVLKSIPEARVYFGEIDPSHEATIRKNICENGLDESRADIRIGDLFDPFTGERFDFIVANPPYVPSDRELPASVAEYEPALALRAGPDGLAVIRRIAAALPTYLKEGGQTWIECDSEHAEQAAECFEAEGFKAIVRTDQYDRPRLLVVSFENA